MLLSIRFILVSPSRSVFLWLFITTSSLHGASSTWVIPFSIPCRGSSVQSTSPPTAQVETATDQRSHAGDASPPHAVVSPPSTVKECANSSPTSYFWFRKALNITNSIEESGEFNSIMTGCLLAAWTIVALAMIKGIKSSAKVVEPPPLITPGGRVYTFFPAVVGAESILYFFF